MHVALNSLHFRMSWLKGIDGVSGIASRYIHHILLSESDQRPVATKHPSGILIPEYF